MTTTRTPMQEAAQKIHAKARHHREEYERDLRRIQHRLTKPLLAGVSPSRAVVSSEELTRIVYQGRVDDLWRVLVETSDAQHKSHHSVERRAVSIVDVARSMIREADGRASPEQLRSAGSALVSSPSVAGESELDLGYRMVRASADRDFRTDLTKILVNV